MSFSAPVEVETHPNPPFRTHPQREAYNAEWRARVARGEDPKQGLVQKVEATPTSSFVEYWWRKATRQHKTKAGEKVRREEMGRQGLLEGNAGSGTPGQREERYGEWEKGARKVKWHDRLRWGL